MADHKNSSNRLINVEEALAAILEQVTPVDTETIPLRQGLHRVLALPVISPVNVPPFVNSAMDGYAVIAADTRGAASSAPVRLRVIGSVPAGASPALGLSTGTAVRIMTGAPMPPGADAVVRFEETSEYIETQSPVAGEVLVYKEASVGDNVRPMGEDISAGQTVLAAGHCLRPQDIGVLAAVGQPEIRVYRRPRVAILATGDELVDVDEPIESGKIRNSNGYTQAALVEKYGGVPVMLGIARDNVTDLTAKIRQGLEQQVDLFITSAGVSVGDFDMVKNVLATEGEMQFWQVAIKPGKPLAFGLLHPDRAGGRSVPLIGLPGNPVAAMVAFEVFARPAILKLGGHGSWEKATVPAKLEEEITNSGRRHYMRAFVRPAPDGYRVTTRGSGVQVQGSGILTSLVWANCMVVVPEKVTHLPAGATVDVWILD